MKKVFLSLALLAMILVMFTTVANAQVPAAKLTVWNLKTYAASQSDTSKSFAIAGYSLSSLGMKYDDSVYVITLVQYSKDGGSTFTFIAGDTLDHTGGGAVTGSTYRELALRTATVDKFGGVGGLIRIIQKFQATLIGVTSPKYTLWMNVTR